ncbi:MAG: response regulator transcription factor [Roseiflexus sp.]|nr:response regulator transcription factor [Roseiflexus sp.]MCS7291305.1 response regulator transcription factor [Roseiflexus sp.]MDW8146651.1 response regulator transcription factor [Roseiflexaceae bacterium]
MSATVLIIEDEASIRTVARAYLEQAGFRVLLATSGPEGLELARRECPDVVILDLNLPGMDGMEVAARLRQESDVFIIMLTARSEESDRVAGLRIGADDYVIKPFSPRELVARVEAILRRRRSVTPAIDSTLRFAHVQIDPDRREVTVGDQVIDLTTTEFDVLLALARRHGRVLSREQILDMVWGNDFYGTDRVVDVYVGQVRRKLEAVAGVPLIQTVRGVGYKFIDTAV